MSEPTAPAADSGELDEIADELYALRPDDFAAARDERVRTARAAGRKPLARDLGGLRRPSQSAWLINLLWRDQRDVLEQFLQLGDELGRAQAEGSGPALLRLTAQRRELEAGLLRGARALAEKAGVNVSASMEREVQETLSAALAQPEVADEVRTGRLVKPTAYAGFGLLMPTVPAAGAGETPILEFRAKPRSAAAGPTVEDTRPTPAEEAEQKRRAEAEGRVQAARAALETATEALPERARAAEAAQAHQEALREQVQDLRKQLAGLEKELVAAERAAVTAASQRDQAQKAHEAARRSLERAES